MKFRIPVLLVLGTLLALGCRVPEDSDQLTRIEEAVAKLDQRLDGLEKKIDEMGKAQPQRAAARPQIDPKVALEKIDVADAPGRGADEAIVTIVEYSDFQCPYCRRARPTLQKILDEYGTQVRHVFKHFPLSFHKEAMNAHKAVAAARNQDRFWEMHDKIFANPRDLSPETMRKYAEELSLDMARYDADYDSKAVADRIEADMKEGREVGVRGTPAFFVNGNYMAGAQPFEAFKAKIDAELEAAKKKQG